MNQKKAKHFMNSVSDTHRYIVCEVRQSKKARRGVWSHEKWEKSQFRQIAAGSGIKKGQLSKTVLCRISRSPIRPVRGY